MLGKEIEIMKFEDQQLLDDDAAYEQQSNEEHRRYVEEMDKDKKYIASVSMSILDKFKKPFPVDQLKWRKGGGGKELVYLGAQQYQHRLDEVMGTDWQCEYNAITESGLTACRVGIKIDDEWIWRSSGAGQTNIEGEKGSFTDSFKRACSAWGIGRYLYFITEGRDLPEWATPEGYDKRMEKKYG